MKFALVGVLNTATDFVVFIFLLRVLDAPILIANLIGVATAVVVSFFANRHWTFAAAAEDAELGGRQQFVRHVILAVVTIGVSSLVIYLAAPFMHALLAKLCASICTFVLSFTVSRKWVFSRELPSR